MVLMAIGAMFMPVMLEGFEAGRQSTRTVSEIDTNVTTSVSGANTSANVTLTFSPYLGTVSSITSISSNITERYAAGASANTVTTKVLLVSGLASNSTRTLTTVYKYGTANLFTGLLSIIQIGPTIIVLGFIISGAVVGFLGVKMMRD